MTVRERVKQNIDRLQLALGTDYAVTGWEYNSYFRPDVATVKRWSDGYIRRIPIESELLNDNRWWSAIATGINEAFQEAQPMKQPTQEQLNDPAWWDKNVDPHFQHVCVIYISGKIWSYECVTPGTTAITIPCNASTRFFCRPQRPTKPAAPEWDGEGLPPVGCECECASIENNGQASWCKVKIVAFGKATVCMESLENIVDAGKWDLFVKDAGRVKFRSIRTKEQREREEFSEKLQADLSVLGTKITDDTATAVAIGFFNRGWRKGGES